MTWTPRRVVTGHDEHGRSVFLSDGPPPVIRSASEGTQFVELWSTDAAPAPVAADEPEPTQRDLTVPPGPHGTKLRINEIPPGAASPMHRTETIDYGVVLSGEIVLELDDGAHTTLRAGDVVIQRGTDHRWENRSSEPARVAFILVDGTFTDELRAILPEGELMDAPPGA
jgi:quercetin dioxygenase-like cupin family protein